MRSCISMKASDRTKKPPMVHRPFRRWSHQTATNAAAWSATPSYASARQVPLFTDEDDEEWV
ncbi:hypothetical protein [Microvirga splendida]|uniref:Uncharacterized protein n=1 Tax=Microvirga splendida TaxID=2795727 RepID=A0ABS0Y908_9HYPH|nr:hypothetical protein [Microvirga splendida]MBJ6128435.1 hypothetical protein [Microvirga splendida]